MTQEELVVAVGTVLVTNWTYFIGGLVAFVSTSILLSWKLAKAFHQKESDLLRTEIAHQKERFSQYETVVAQRISLLTKEAELLKDKINPPKETVFYQGSAPTEEPEPEIKAVDGARSLKPSYARPPINEPLVSAIEQVRTVLEKTDAISSIIKAATLKVK